MYEVHYPLWTGSTNVLVSFAASAIAFAYALRRGSVYFLRKTNTDAVSWIFAARSLAVAYLLTSIPLGHSTVDVPGAWKFGGDSATGA